MTEKKPELALCQREMHFCCISIYSFGVIESYCDMWTVYVSDGISNHKDVINSVNSDSFIWVWTTKTGYK